MQKFSSTPRHHRNKGSIHVSTVGQDFLSGFVLVVVNVTNQNDSTQTSKLVCGNHHHKILVILVTCFSLDPEGSQNEFSTADLGRTSSVSGEALLYHTAAMLT